MDIMHVLIDGKALAKPNVDLIRNVVAVIPDLISMTKVGDPMVIKEKDEIVGIQVIAESHVSLTAKGNMVWIDIFSCKSFDVNAKALPYLVKLFKFGDNYTVKQLDRGLEFVDSIAMRGKSGDSGAKRMPAGSTHAKG